MHVDDDSSLDKKKRRVELNSVRVELCVFFCSVRSALPWMVPNNIVFVLGSEQVKVVVLTV